MGARWVTAQDPDELIADFEQGSDLIDLRDYDGVSSIRDLTITQEDANTVISGYNGEGNTVILENFAADTLSNDDFILAPPPPELCW